MYRAFATAFNPLEIHGMAKWADEPGIPVDSVALLAPRQHQFTLFRTLPERAGIGSLSGNGFVIRELKIITYPTHGEKGDYPQTLFPNPIGAQSVFQSCAWLLA